MLPIKYLNSNSTTTTTSKMADILWKETPPSDVLPQDLVKSHSREIRCYNDRIYRSEILHATRQRCQIGERMEKSKPESRGFETSRDLAIRRPSVNTPFTQGLRPLCLPCATTKLSRSPLKAEGRQNGCIGRSRVVHRTFRHRHGRHGRREVLSMFKTVAQRSPRRSVAHRSLKGGRMKAHTSPWSQNGCTVVGHWSPS